MTNLLLDKPPFAKPRFRTQNVLALCSHFDGAARISDAFRSDEAFELHIITAEEHDGFRNFAIPDAVDALVIDADLSDDGMGPAIERAVNATLNGRPLIVRCESLKPDALRRVLRLGAAEFVDAASPASDIVGAAHRVLAAREAPHSARVTAFFGVRGGVGVSTLAVETAVGIAQRLPANSRGACLVDLNFQFGVDAALLNVHPNLRLHNSIDVEQIDAQMLDAFLSAHKSRLKVLAAAPEWRQPHTAMDGVARLLDITAERFEHVVIDLPKDFSAVTESVLSSADQIFLVTDLTVPGLQLARQAIAALDSRLSNGAALSVIVNRASRWDRGVSLTMRDVRRHLQCERVFLVHEDPETAAESLDRGEPVLSARPDSRLGREIMESIRQAFPLEFGEDARKDRKPKGFLNLTKYR